MSNNKKITIAGAILFLTFVSVQVFQNETQAQEPLVTPDAVSAVDGGNNQKGAEILALLADLKSVRLNESIFSDPVFQSLVDTSIELSPEPKGRPNPFAPLGKDIVLNEDFSGFATTSLRDIPFNTEVDTTTKTKKPIGSLKKNDAPVVVVPVGGI